MGTLPRLVRESLRSIRFLAGRERWESELDEEMRFHLDMREQRIRESSATAEPDAARLAAVRRFGNTTALRERGREAWIAPWLESVAQDTRLAFRAMIAQPAYAALGAGSLAVAIAACTVAFGLAHALLLKPLPYAHAERLTMIYEDRTSQGFPRGDTSPANFRQLQSEARSFSDMAMLHGSGAVLTAADGDSERVDGAAVTANFFDLLGVRPAHGRFFRPEEASEGGGDVAVLTHELWMRSFGGDPALVGRSIHMNERPTIVVGILPPRFQFFYPDAQVWMPIQFDTRTWARRDLRYLHVVGRLRDNVTVRQAQSELDVLSQSLRAAAPVANLNFKAVAIDLRTDLTGSARTRVLLLAACAALVFGIACINVVHLILSRSVRRASDLAVRLSLGATRARLMRQLFTEGFALSTVAGLSGLALAWWSLPFLTFLVPEAMAVYTTLQPSPGTGLVALLLSLSAAALCGIVPAVRLAGMNWHDTIKHGSTRVVGGFGHERLRGLLVMSEVALAVLLVVGASLLMRTLLEVLHVDAGFSPENVLTAVTTPPRDLRSFEVRTVFIDSAVARLRSIPGVANVAFMSAVPFTWKGGKLEFAVEGQVPQPEQAALNRQVTPEYFRTLRIPLRAGREFSDDDRASTQRVGIVNEALVRSYLAGGTAIGRRIRVRGPGFDATPITIVGVAADVKEMGLLQPALPMIYLPHSQTRATFNVPFQVAVRTTGDPAAAAPSLRRQLAEGWPGMPVTKVRTLEAIFEKEMADRRPMALLAAGLAAVALLLACIGIHGLLAFAVAQRLPEIGIRHALGAPPVRLLCDVLGQGVALSLAGVVLGLAVSAVLVTTIRGVLYGVSPVDPVTFAAAPVLVLAIACSAAFFPARAALKTDPARALRAE